MVLGFAGFVSGGVAASFAATGRSMRVVCSSTGVAIMKMMSRQKHRSSSGVTLISLIADMWRCREKLRRLSMAAAVAVQGGGDGVSR